MPANQHVKPAIPDKLYFKIGEVSQITGLPAYVLRFWETEFRGIHPKRTSTGQRMYRKSDVELIFDIKHLLHEKKFTIRGAKQHLKDRRKKLQSPQQQLSMGEIRSELLEIRDLLG
jgi:DNA-binding transcriptional MerR regulator